MDDTTRMADGGGSSGPECESTQHRVTARSPPLGVEVPRITRITSQEQPMQKNHKSTSHDQA